MIDRIWRKIGQGDRETLQVLLQGVAFGLMAGLLQGQWVALAASWAAVGAGLLFVLGCRSKPVLAELLILGMIASIGVSVGGALSSGMY